MDKRTEQQKHRRHLASKAAKRYIANTESYKLHFICLSLWLEGFTAGLRHAGRVAKRSKP